MTHVLLDVIRTAFRIYPITRKSEHTELNNLMPYVSGSVVLLTEILLGIGSLSKIKTITKN